MQVSSPTPDEAKGWRALYRAAVTETDRSLIVPRVSAAETAIVARGRRLFYSGGTLEEKEALDDALYILRALRMAIEHTEAA